MKRLFAIRLAAAAVFFAAALAAFLLPNCAFFAGWNFMPALLRFLAGVSLTAGAVVLLHLILAGLFGRIYCGVFCPLGILQDLLCGLFRRRGKVDANRSALRFLIAAIVFGSALGAFAIPAAALDPYSRFGSMTTQILEPILGWVWGKCGGESAWNSGEGILPLMGGGVFFLILLCLLTFWKKRVYCTSLCPVGTVLGLCSRHALFQLKLNWDLCLECGKCVKTCPAGCIDPKSGSLDNERCLRCMNCIHTCPVGAIGFVRAESKSPAAPKLERATEPDSTRRRLLAGSALLLAGGAFFFGRGIRPTAGNDNQAQATPPVLPPGAGGPARFQTLCTGCGLCVSHCLGRVLTPQGLAPNRIELDYRRGFCEFDCTVCSDICPTGAIRPLALATKKQTRIGLAEFHPSRCIAVQEEIHCGACAEHCPTGALRMVEVKGSPCPTPKLDIEICIGCGNCVTPCPVRPERAMSVQGVELQTVVPSPEDYFRQHPPQSNTPDNSGEEWLL